MPPKNEEIAQLAERFHRFGLPEKQALDTARNPKIANKLTSIIENISSGGADDPSLEPKLAGLLAQWSTASSKLDGPDTAYGAKAIVDGRLASSAQLDAAAKYLQSEKARPVRDDAFNTECGVGVKVTKEQIVDIVRSHVEASTIAASGRWTALGKTLGELKADPRLRWAPQGDVKDAVEQVFTERFGPKGASTSAPAAGSKKGAVAPAANAAKGKAKEGPLDNAEGVKEPSIFEVGMLSQLHKPGGNAQLDPKLTEDHLKATGGRVITRFPPEPNGFLHIGHSKAIAVNFGFAAYHDGTCNLRYDDTNPEAEEQVYFDSILEIIRWLGFEPHRVTYSSDNFQQLYDLAVELIKRDKAYVCFCTAAEIKANRGGEERGPRVACAHRNAPVADSLAAFAKMKDGGYGPNEAILRMKQDLEDGNPQMWDLVAYRVLDASHHRTGSDWRIYPTYDFTHCLCDSFENITHSLCTTEFIQSRVSYEWLCHAVDVYTPRQTEYGRLNLEGTVMSKRKIAKLVKGGYVDGWDDPRLYTLIALRRRGVPPEAILKFVNGLGVSTAITNIPTHRFEQTVRAYLELSTPRLMMILRPLKVTIENLPEDFVLFVERPLHPKVPAMGTTKMPFTKHLWIDESDFRAEASKDFFRLTPGATVGFLSAPHPITCVSFKTDGNGKPVELICRYENGPGTVSKPKGWIHWVAEHKPSGSPIVVDETRLYRPLFKSANPAALDDYLTDINPDSLEIVKGSLLEVGFWPVAKHSLAESRRKAKEQLAKAEQFAEKPPEDAPHRSADQTTGLESVRFQGMRTAYFTLDRTTELKALQADAAKDADSKGEGDKLVLNWIVSLKEDVGKSA